MTLISVMQRYRVTLTAPAVLLMVAGCTVPQTQQPNENANAKAPDIPPLSSFVMDFDEFSGGGAAKFATTTQVNTSLVRGRASLQVVVWQGILAATLVIPVAALAESFNHAPVFQDGEWIWSYDFRAAGVLHSAELHGRTVDDRIEWRMLISQDGAFTDVEWFTGTSGILSRSGTWTVNYDPQQVIPFLRIDYNRDADNPDLGQITYTSIEEGGDLEGSYIAHAAIDGADYDRSYSIYLAEPDNLVEIEWDHLMIDGRTKDPAFYGDDEWRCWNEELNDIECPSGQ